MIFLILIKELNTDRDDGIYVAKVSRSSELKTGDIITKIDDKTVKEDTDLRTYLYQNRSLVRLLN